MMGFHSFSLRSLLSAAALTLLAAILCPSQARCVQIPATPPPATQPAKSGEVKLTGRSWKLISLNGHDLDPSVLKPPQMSLVEVGTRILGYSGCNRFLGTYSLKQDQLSINSDLVVTRRTCPSGMDVEAEFVKTLKSVDSWEIVADVLQLSRQKQVIARFK